MVIAPDALSAQTLDDEDLEYGRAHLGGADTVWRRVSNVPAVWFHIGRVLRFVKIVLI